MDVYDEDREFGPVFNASHFLLPVLRLQKAIEAIVAEDGTTFQDVCNAPLSPQSKICNVQSLWAYWQVGLAWTVLTNQIMVLSLLSLLCHSLNTVGPWLHESWR